MDTYHRWMEVAVPGTMAGLPVINVPAGFGPGGLPMGLQIIGKPQGELALLQLAYAYEQVCGYTAKRPALLG
jgi:amidase